MPERLLAVLHRISHPAVAIGGSLAIAVVVIGGTWYLTSVSPSGTYTAAKTASITEEVDVSGTVNAAQNTDLSFLRSGQVSYIAVKVGQHVSAGQTLVALNHADLDASLEQAQANLAGQEARLASLQAGTRPEQLSLAQTAVSQAQDALRNAIQNAYVNADDAVHNKTDQFFSNPRTSTAMLTFTLPDSTLQNSIQKDRVALEPVLAAWQAQVYGASFTSEDPSAAAKTAESNLAQVNAFLNETSAALGKASASGSLSAATASGYQTSVQTARLALSGSLTALTSAETAVATAAGNLTLAQAGATANDIAAQTANVAAAQAGVDSVKVQISQAVLFASISGTVTRQDANQGQSVSPGLPLVSLIADGKFEVEAQVSQSDIGKIKIGDTVVVTVNSAPGSSFSATITAVDPAATMTSGVASYKVTATLAENYPEIVSGLTANLRIITDTATGAIVVPTSAIITSGDEKFVYVKEGDKNVKRTVTVSIQSADGMTMVSNVQPGEEVLTFGASAQ